MFQGVIYGSELAPPDLRGQPFGWMDELAAYRVPDGFDDDLSPVTRGTDDEGRHRDTLLILGGGERRPLPTDPRNANVQLLNLSRYFPKAPLNPLEQADVECRGGISFESARPAHYVGDAFCAGREVPRSLPIAAESESFLWVTTQANGDFAYSCGGERRTGNLQPFSLTPFQTTRGCLGRFCGRSVEHPWGNKELLVEVTSTRTSTGPNLRFQGVMACDAGTAPREGAGIPGSCSRGARFEDAYWPVRGHAQLLSRATHDLSTLR